MSTVEKLPRSIKPPVLVLGATDGLGVGLVEAGLEAGYPVLGVGSDREQLDALRERFADKGRISTLQGSVMTDADAALLAKALLELPIKPVVAIINLHVTCERGRLLDHDAGFLQRILNQEVLPHMHAARHLLPLLGESGRCARFLVMGGPNADTSWVGYGHHSIAAAATRMLVRALRRETEDSPVRVQQLAIGKPVRTEHNARCACPEWPDALSIGRYAMRLLADSDTADAVVRYESTIGEADVDMEQDQTISR
jgi:NAD(P)-dependent dehydrogenase (short-subunit alcohol dehydrogenase family)